MKYAIAVLSLVSILSGCKTPENLPTPRPGLTLEIDGLTFETGAWVPDLPAGQAGVSKGNHRAVIRLDSAFTNDGTSAVWAHIPWRRSDAQPDQKRIVVIDAESGDSLSRVLPVRIDNESGDILFEPNPDSREYYVYFLPYETSGGYYPRLSYLKPARPGDSEWERSLEGVDTTSRAGFSQAVPRSIQSIDDFHSFVPMEVIATAAETSALTGAGDQAFYLFPEDRRHPIRMRSRLPKRWADRGMSHSFEGVARRGEFYSFQIGVYAAHDPVANVGVSFSDLSTGSGDAIPRRSLTCFNLGGVDEKGQAFTKTVDVDSGFVQPLWIGVQIPDDAKPGDYSGTVTVTAEGLPAQTVDLILTVDTDGAVNHGDNSPELMTRLRWLNSTIGSDADFIIDPYIPVSVDGHSLQILGRSVGLGVSGLPTRITSYFPQEMDRVSTDPHEILSAPVQFLVQLAGGAESFTYDPFQVRRLAEGRAEWESRGRSDRFQILVDGALEYDGMLDYRIRLVAEEDVAISDVALPLAYEPEAARYVLGLGHKGQKRPEKIDWKWQVENHQEGLWLGGVNRGLQFVLRDEHYRRPLNTNFYQNQPLILPDSWYNGGRGGIRVRTEPEHVLVENYSGARRMEKGDTLQFNVRFLITPFKPLDTEAHFNTRFVHKYVPVDSVLSLNGTVVNIHHANEINPYINYPFYNLDLQSAYIEEAHRKGIKVKLYYTIRELTYKAYELFALRSLGDEILNDGEGGGHSWLQEHLQDHYHSAWHAYRVDDAAILNKGTSRWTNYYVEGLNWLAENQKIDGLYLDDIAFSRETVKRMTSVLNNHRDEVVIDLHSANQFNPRDGFINSAMLYMEHFPFISRLWFGEYFDYDADPDYWITEVSGLPFGLMGEMLQDCGHPYRGLLYGMTTRSYGNCDPGAVWNLMSEFGIAESRMLGYWLDDAPVHTGDDRIRATSFVRDDRVLIVLASWAPEDVTVQLQIDAARLGFEPASVRAIAPAVNGLQSEREIDLLLPVEVEANRGLFIVLTRNG